MPASQPHLTPVAPTKGGEGPDSRRLNFLMSNYTVPTNFTTYQCRVRRGINCEIRRQISCCS